MLDFMRRQRSNLKWVWVILIFIFSVTLVTLYIPFGDLGNVSITNDVAAVGGESGHRQGISDRLSQLPQPHAAPDHARKCCAHFASNARSWIR